MSLYPTPGPERTFRPVRLKQARRVGSGFLVAGGLGVDVGERVVLEVGGGLPQAGIATAMARISRSRDLWFRMDCSTEEDWRRLRGPVRSSDKRRQRPWLFWRRDSLCPELHKFRLLLSSHGRNDPLHRPYLLCGIPEVRLIVLAGINSNIGFHYRQNHYELVLDGCTG